MKTPRIANSVGHLDDDLITAAAECKKIKKNTVLKWVAVAACLTLIVTAAISIFSLDDSMISTDNSKLPKITMTDFNEMSDGFGSEILMAYQISDLSNNNPWTKDSELSTLPVYKNLYTYDGNGDIIGDVDKYTDKLLNGVLKKVDDLPVCKIKKSYDGMAIDIEFDPEIKLDRKYNFTFNSTLEELTRVGDYFKKEYKKIIDMNNPTLNIYEGDYSIYGKQLFNIFIYDNSGSLTDRIINYHFHQVHFFPSDSGGLSTIRIQKTDLSHKVGDYPIIDYQEAERLLFDGGYITTVPYTLTKEDTVAKVELVYRNGCNEKYFMPYYKFYVEVKSEVDKNGLKDFGVYYVPAVESQYITNMPVWDGSFN